LDSDEKPSHLPKKLMVAGMGTLSVSAIEIISALSKVIEVEVLCVNPSPYLSKEWSKQHSQIQVASGNAPARLDDLHVLPESDVLVTTWLRESYELQMLLTSQGVEYVTSEVSQSTSKSTKLLHRMHAAVQTPNSLQSQPLDAGDLSVQIHRAHTLGRQAEILRDALLHSFSTIDNLQPHEVIVLCADIEAAAPLLRATFEEPLTLGSGERVKIPFVVADRTLRESSIGAELAADILSLIGSRFDVDSVVNIATHELVLKNAYMGSGDVDAWLRHIHNTRVRWGLDVEHRKLNGLDAPEITAHTWKQLVDRTLLGALLPDAEETMFEMGGIVPVPRIDTTEIEALTGFAEVLSVLASLEHDSQSDMSIDFWCDRIEATLISLCGRSCTDLDDVLAVINKFREAALLASAGNQSVAFSEFAFLVTSEISAQSGRQSLVTGAVTATSFIPLRAVPFRVVCVVGLDDGTMSIGDSEGDDLIAMEQLMGDTDMRTANRRVLLDAVVAASEQLIITCNGSSVKNNTRVPFITPLAELVDFCGRLGVNVPNESEKPCEIEYLHSRHSSGTANFVANNGPVSGQIWSHDASALNAALSRSQVVAPQVKTYVPSPKPAEIEIGILELFVIDPLKYYLRESLQIFTEYEEEDAKAVLPLDANEFEIANLVEALVDASPNGDLEAGRSIWMPSAEASDALPVAPFAESQIDLAFAIANAVRGAATQRGIPLSEPDPIEFSLLLLDGSTIVCDVANVVESPTDGFVYSISYHSKSTKEIIRQSVRLLALCAAGKLVQKAYVIQMDDNKSLVLVNEIELSPEISAEEALRRLLELSKAAHIARDIPCAKFDKTGQAIAEVGTINDDSVIDAFETFVDGFSYERSAEFVVYGADPVFEHVFADNSDKKIEVLTALVQGCNLEKDGKKKDSYQHWVVK
jgi:exodeoxyribonuclease V gamma subunit